MKNWQDDSINCLIMFDPDARQLRSPRSRMRLVQIQDNFVFLNLKNKNSRIWYYATVKLIHRCSQIQLITLMYRHSIRVKFAACELEWCLQLKRIYAEVHRISMTSFILLLAVHQLLSKISGYIPGLYKKLNTVLRSGIKRTISRTFSVFRNQLSKVFKDRVITTSTSRL